ncbi:MAG: PilZ domain-containing protein [Proteobacteria bacterium]|nr:PilZ domain-containing protein [Pseudomonadota bacterium]
MNDQVSNDDWWLGEPGTADVSQFSAEDASAPGTTPFLNNVRSSDRYLVRWKMAVVFDGQEGRPTYHGRTHDLSLSGTGMLTDINLQKSKSPVIVLLAPPPLHRKERPKLIEIRSRQLDVVYSGENRSFRLGFAFLEFKNDGLDFLKDRLRTQRPVSFSRAIKAL